MRSILASVLLIIYYHNGIGQEDFMTSKMISQFNIFKVKLDSIQVGTAFRVDSLGNVMTNFHVIEKGFQFRGDTIEFNNNISLESTGNLGPFTRSHKYKIHPGIISDKRMYTLAKVLDLMVLVPDYPNKRKNGYHKSEYFSFSDGFISNMEGYEAWCAGYPFGMKSVVYTKGVVSGSETDILYLANNDGGHEKVRIYNVIADFTANQGNSGGPVLHYKKDKKKLELLGVLKASKGPFYDYLRVFNEKYSKEYEKHIKEGTLSTEEGTEALEKAIIFSILQSHNYGLNIFVSVQNVEFFLDRLYKDSH